MGATLKSLKERVEAWSKFIDPIEDESIKESTADILEKTFQNMKNNNVIRTALQNIKPIRSKIFSEFAMEASQNDVIHYCKPVYTPLPKLIGDGRYRVIEEGGNIKEEFNQIWDIVNTLKK